MSFLTVSEDRDIRTRYDASGLDNDRYYDPSALTNRLPRLNYSNHDSVALSNRLL